MDFEFDKNAADRIKYNLAHNIDMILLLRHNNGAKLVQICGLTEENDPILDILGYSPANPKFN